MSLKKDECIAVLRARFDSLGRLPKKSDFDADTVNRIKSYFGPWPRALEAAGLKAPDAERLRKKKEKRERARKNRNRYRAEHPKQQGEITGEK